MDAPILTDEPFGSSVYELRLGDFFVDGDEPPAQSPPAINPRDFFITSGDAIQKTLYLKRRLEQQLTTAAAPARARIVEQLAGAERLLAALVKARGKAKFVETEWSNHCLYVFMKNPRAKPCAGGG